MLNHIFFCIFPVYMLLFQELCRLAHVSVKILPNSISCETNQVAAYFKSTYMYTHCCFQTWEMCSMIIELTFQRRSNHNFLESPTWPIWQSAQKCKKICIEWNQSMLYASDETIMLLFIWKNIFFYFLFVVIE